MGAQYKYPHDYGGYVRQQYLPDSLKNRNYYVPSQNGFEAQISAFQKEKEALAREHQIIQDRKVAEETAQLEQLKTSGREPLSIPELDERKNILNTEPRSPQMNPNMDLHKNKTLQQ